MFQKLQVPFDAAADWKGRAPARWECQDALVAHSITDFLWQLSWLIQ
jgi:hypothetical protein